MSLFVLFLVPLEIFVEADGMVAQEFAELAHFLLVFAVGAVMLLAGDIPVGLAFAPSLFLFVEFLFHLVNAFFISADAQGVVYHQLPQLRQFDFGCLNFVFHNLIILIC